MVFYTVRRHPSRLYSAFSGALACETHPAYLSNCACRGKEEKKSKNAPEGVGNPEETLEIDLLTPLASVNMGSGSGPLLGKA